MNKRKPDPPEFDISSWIIIGAAFIFGLWPIAIILLLRKLDIIPAWRGSSSGSRVNDTASRFERYRIIIEGNDSMPIEYIASAAGVSFETALREIRQMLARGDFGSEAYINYLTKTLVLKSSGAEGAASAPRSTNSKKSGSKPKKSSSGKTPSTGALGAVLSIIGVLLIAFAGITAISGGSLLLTEGLSLSTVWTLLTALFSCVGGAAAFVVRGRLKKRVRRFSKYLAIIGKRKIFELSALASTVGVSQSTVVRDLEAMIEKGLFSKSAYVDLGLGCIILSPDARPEYKKPEPEQPPESQYAAILREIRELDDAIADPGVSERIVRIEGITAKIFRLVEEKPEKLPQIKSFMSYYLPTTLKLLRSYATFEKQGISGENIDSARRDIERILDTLSVGFAQQLDQLFSSEALDISSDIDVLESMLKKDGLSSDQSNFRVSGGF